MDKLRLKNFRSINDSGDIDIKPLTVFLGKNSSGKSSFIRMFPLIKQSLEVDIQEPILWYGNYVDFGDYNNILPKDQNNESTNFKIEFDIKLKTDDESVYKSLLMRFINPEAKIEELNIHVSVEFRRKYIYSFEIVFFDQTFFCIFNKDNALVKCIVNGFEDIEGMQNYKIVRSKGDFLQNFIYKPKGESDKYIKYYAVQEGELEPLAKFLKNSFNIETERELILDFILKSIWLQPKQQLLKFFKECESQLIIKDYFSDKDINDSVFNRINNQMLLCIIPSLIRAINYYLEDVFSNTYYLKPLRAQANRYYRVQGISIKKVDSDGSNLPMILYNMSKAKQKEFSDWCYEKLGLRFSIKRQKGHVSLMVSVEDNYEINLADAGYGYSQVLPLILQLWLLTDKKRIRNNYIVVIEQPELHLHPAFQTKLIDVFVSLVSLMESSGNRIKIIFETHSEHMVNRLGELVSCQKIKKEDINIVLVDKVDNITNFRQTSFNTDGLVYQWPIGFMSPGD